MALAIDGTAKSSSGSSASTAVTLTTSNANDIIVVAATGNATASGVSGGSLTWTQQASSNNAGANVRTSIWTAPSSGTLSSATLTVTFTGSAFNTCWAFGVSGGNTSSPLDPNGANPQTGTSNSPSYSTTDSSSFVIAAWTNANVSSPITPTGFTQVVGDSGAFANVAYDIVSGAQSGTTVNLDATGSVAEIILALAPAAAAFTAKFRKDLSPIGGRVGSRQAWSN